jgi:hypothetical protein
MGQFSLRSHRTWGRPTTSIRFGCSGPCIGSESSSKTNLLDRPRGIGKCPARKKTKSFNFVQTRSGPPMPFLFSKIKLRPKTKQSHNPRKTTSPNLYQFLHRSVLFYVTQPGRPYSGVYSRYLFKLRERKPWMKRRPYQMWVRKMAGTVRRATFKFFSLE